MNKTKKGLIIAGSIISIIEACMLVIVGIFVLSARGLIDVEFVEEMLKDEGVAYTTTDINDLLNFSKMTCLLIGLSIFLQALALGIVSVLLLNKTKKNIYSKKLNIILLVFSILIGDLLVMAFMIAGLAIKDEKPTLENIKEIGEKHNISEDIIEEKIEEIKEEKEDK